MTQFIAVVHKDPDSAYGVHFPDAPGCFSAADTADELLPNAVDALSLWFEDQPLVQPSDFEVVRGAVAEDLAEGAFLISVPYVERPTRPVKVNLSLEAGVVEAIDEMASLRKQTRSALITELSMKELGIRIGRNKGGQLTLDTGVKHMSARTKLMSLKRRARAAAARKPTSAKQT